MNAVISELKDVFSNEQTRNNYINRTITKLGFRYVDEYHGWVKNNQDGFYTNKITNVFGSKFRWFPVDDFIMKPREEYCRAHYKNGIELLKLSGLKTAKKPYVAHVCRMAGYKGDPMKMTRKEMFNYLMKL